MASMYSPVDAMIFAEVTIIRRGVTIFPTLEVMIRRSALLFLEAIAMILTSAGIDTAMDAGD